MMQILQSLPVSWQTVLLLMASNVFMTFAWYGHLKNLATAPWYIAALISWGIALFEYLLQVPANRIGFTQFNVGQLKILQEVITLGKQYHILRPSARKDGVFIYFVLDKQRANLAMARRKVLDVDKEMNF